MTALVTLPLALAACEDSAPTRPALPPTDASLGRGLTGPAFKEERIVFMRGSANDWGNVFTMRTDGSDIKQITSDPVEEGMASWSPDYKKLVFVKQTGAQNGTGRVLHIMNADGSNVVQVTQPAANSTDGFPRWSPDGKKLVFMAMRDGNPEIYTVNTDGSQLTRVTNHPQSDESPAWSADSKRIFFSSNRGTSGYTDIYVMNADGTNVTKLTGGRTNKQFPMVSPDGTKIVYQTAFWTQASGTVGEIRMMNVDGTNDVLLVADVPGADYNSHPSWSRDGTKVVYNYSQLSVAPTGAEIRVLDLATQQNTTLTPAVPSSSYPIWAR